MTLLKTLITSLLLLAPIFCQDEEDKEFLYDVFPEDFQWGIASSSHQIEGAWNEDGKSQNIWDTFCLDGRIYNNDTAFVTCDSYHRYQQDVQAIADLGVNFYRFSISWARILPDLVTVNEAGIQYYNDLIDALLGQGVQPMVTLYHWDMPQVLQDQGGFLNESVFMEYFEIYSRLCFDRFGDRAKLWITFNEPWIIAHHGYGIGIFAPGIYGPGTTIYQAAHTLLKTHAEIWHIYDEEYRATQGGQISITLNGGYSIPLSEGETNQNASERAMQFDWGWFAHPIWVGDYPQLMKDRIAERSLDQGFEQSRLPEFTEEEIERIRGTWDFFGVNHYTSSYVYDDRDRPTEDVSFDADKGIGIYVDPDWPTSGSDWLRVTPYYFRYLLRWIRDNYDNPPVLITENGMSDQNATLEDGHRVYYYRYYINEMLKAIKLDGCNVTHYTAWTLMDNFEWVSGYLEKFGIYKVNFTDPDLARVPKDSARFYTQVIADNGFPDPNPPVVVVEPAPIPEVQQSSGRDGSSTD